MTGLDIQFRGRSSVTWKDEVDFKDHDIFLESGSGLGFSQHHIVPFNALLCFWNHLVKNGMFGRCAAILTALADRSAHYPISFDENRRKELREFAGLIVHCSFKKGVGVRELGEEHHKDLARVYDDAHSVYSYPAVDVFPGPVGSKRVDDAGDGFEDVAVHVIGSKGDWSRLKRAESALNGAINEANMALKEGRKINESVMEAGVKSLISVIDGNSPECCGFDKDKWDWINHENGYEFVVTDREKWQNISSGNRKYRVRPRRA